MKYKIWFVLLLSLNSCYNAEPATYYLPGNFEGVFAVVYDQEKGLDDKIVNGRHQFYIPLNGILLTKAKFSDGWRDDLFLIKSDQGYDTLMMYLPNINTTGRKFDGNHFKAYTNDSNEVAVNFRQIVNSTFDQPNLSGNKVNSCNFQYELNTIGKSAKLSDSAGENFIQKLDKFLRDTICKQMIDIPPSLAQVWFLRNYPGSGE